MAESYAVRIIAGPPVSTLSLVWRIPVAAGAALVYLACGLHEAIRQHGQ